MAEVGVSVAAKLGEYLVDPTIRQLQYLFCVGKVAKTVEIGKEELIFKQGRVQERVQEAINRTDRIDDEVDKWKKDVESLIAEVENLEQELKANNGCLRGWCPTWRRYCLCKKLAKTTKRMIDLNTKSDCFNPFSHPVIIPDIEYHTSQNFKLFNSTQIAFGQLWEALKDDGSFIIGLWGMGGSGKTTLVKEVGKKAKDAQLFDRVVLTTISQSPDIRKIQGEIADTLGIELKEESEIGRAKRIALRLESGEQILIILDDAWAKLNLEDIGIPFGGNHQRSCKVVLTTRRLDVCTLMECQQMIQLDLLKQDEAWTLFQTHANVGDAAKEDVARAIAMECKGLPIAIVAVGTCLKGKGIDEMKEMMYRLRNAKPINVDKGVRDAFACLELSYDYLAIQEAKLLLLMCAIFPEDHKIVVEDLFRYGMGLGLCRDVDSFETARSKVRTTINHLIDSSLLMHSPEFKRYKREYVRMHDVVRDFALWKASKEDRTIMVNCTNELNELIVDEAVKDCYAISSWFDDNKLLQFPSTLDAPKLEFLLLHSTKPWDILHAPFEGSKGLKALIIKGTHGRWIELQPQSIQWLSNLQTLLLQNWDLGDISFVVSLTRLEILDLQGSKFERVPNGIEKLNKLKLLDLSGCRIDECCCKVIGRFSQLEELYVSMQCSHSKNDNCYEYLVGLTALIKLRRYKLEIGGRGGGLVFRNEGTRYLCLCQLNTSMLGAIIKDLAQRATVIRFYEFKGGSDSFMANIVQAIGSMNELTKLCLRKCSEIECITDETTPHEDVIVPRLDELVLNDMDNLKQLHHGPSPFSLLQKLERLSVFNCPQLLNIFPANCNLGNLKFLSISSCPMLISLFPVSAACTLLSLEELKIEYCNELKHVLDGEVGGDTWENSRFPKLKILSVRGCFKLESVCTTFLSLRFVQLQHLSIINAPQMKFVFAGEQLMHDQDETQIMLPLLEYLRLQNLPSLVRICSERNRPWCPSIKTIKWRDCPNMELQELKGHQWRNEELYQPLTAIERIVVANCGVESIFHYQIGVKEQIPTFQYLKELTLERCARLKFVFSTHTCQNLPELTSITISCCEELEAIVLGNEETQKNLPIAESFLLKLKRLGISKCDKLTFVLSFMISDATSMLPQLSTLDISDCSQMEEVFRCSNIEHHDIDSDRKITFPNMKSVELNNLPRLVNVCQGFKFHTGELGRVEIHDCPKLMPVKSATIDWTKEELAREYVLKYSQINDNEALNLPFSVLIVGELDVQSPRAEHKWRIIGDDDQEETNNSGMLRSEQQMLGGVVPTQVMSFQYLHSLRVTNCKKLKFLFSKSTIAHNSLPKLKFLTLSDCEELEEIIAENEDHHIESNVQVGFPELRELKVERCNKLKRLFSASTTTILSQLNYLFIAEADQLEVIFGHGSEDDANYSETIVLLSLRKIELRNLPNLISACQGLQFQEQLSDISICNCPKFVSSLGSASQQLSTISELPELNVHQLRNEEYKSLTARRRITLDNCGVESILEYQTGLEEQVPTFQWLKELTLKKCARLKFVFSAHICQSLPELTSVVISCCEELEAVFSGNEETQENLSIAESCLLKLKRLQISKCNKLKFILSFMISVATSMLPQLSTLIVSDCSQMEEIFKCSNIEDHHTESEREIKFPNMEHMELNNLPILVNVCQGFKLHTGERCKVKVHDCPKLIPIESATVDWTKKRLVGEYELKYSQLINFNEALNLLFSFLIAGELDIQSVRVEHEWRVIGDDEQEETNDSEMLRLEQQMLGGVVPPQVMSFQYLHSLEVIGIKKLKFLFSKGTIVQNSLPNLTSLTLSDCEELEEIIAGNEDHQIESNLQVGFPELRELTVERCNKLERLFSASASTIVLSSLRNIKLSDLPNFMSVCQGLQFQAVEPRHISICNCPKFVDSSLGSALQQLGTISLPQVSTEDSNFQTSSRAEYLRLADSMNLTSVWEGPTFIMFQNLKWLYVSECGRLKCIFPSTVTRSLPCLRYLWIEECEELEEVMSSDEEEEHNHFPNNSLCFPGLKYLTVMRCSKLKWLFPSLPSTQPLPLLYRLKIEECSQLKGLCNGEGEIHEEGLMLPTLKYLTVKDCPIFSETTLAALQSLAETNRIMPPRL